MAEAELKIDSRTLGLLALQWGLFLGNFGLYWSLALPLWLHVILGVIPIHLAFTLWHEAVHGTVSNRRWVNNTVGVLGMFPYLTPYFMQKFIHLDHHKYLNQSSKDPNQIYAAGPFWQLPFRYLRAIAYAKKVLAEDPRNQNMRISDTAILILVALIFGVSIWQSFFLDLLCLWILPLIIGKLFMDWYINYLPHTGLPPDRFLGTRIIDVKWFTPLVLCHNYHAIHHLWPKVPWHQYIARFQEKREYLNEHHVPIEHHLFSSRHHLDSVTSPQNQSEPRNGA